MTAVARVGADEAVAAIGTGATLMVGGFGLIGTPLTLLDALRRAPAASGLTVIANNVGQPGEGLGALLREGRLARAIGSYFTSNPDVIDAVAAGELEVDLVPQGTLAESIRAGGAGIPAFFTPTAAGTALAVDREEREFDGVAHVLCGALRADFALIRAKRADELGNLSYHRTAMNFNPEMATAATHVIAEVDEIVPVGELAPADIHTPHLYVDQLVEAEITL